MRKKKPMGSAWDEFVAHWNTATHAEKLALAENHQVTYDTAKHWISEAGQARPKIAAARGTLTTEELLDTRPSVNLDFVSFDLETSNLKADFSLVLCACIKPFGQPVKVFRADSYPTWKTDRANDKPIVEAVSEELRKHAIVVTHYGSGFDVPYLRAKLVKYNLDPLPPMFAVDSYQIARQNFQVSSRRLKNLAEYFEIGDKTAVDGDHWVRAAYDADPEALNYIVEHNIIDVQVLEKLACLSFPYLRSIRRL